MGTRIQLHEKFMALFGSHNIYFQPPENVKLKYPAIIYDFDGFYTRPANDKKYVTENRYSVTFIHRDPDIHYEDDMFAMFPWCSFDRRFVNDNLYHDVYTLYY